MGESENNSHFEQEISQTILCFINDAERKEYIFPDTINEEKIKIIQKLSQNFDIISKIFGKKTRHIRIYKSLENIPAGLISQEELSKLVEMNVNIAEYQLKNEENMQIEGDKISLNINEEEENYPLYYITPQPYLREEHLAPEGKLIKRVIKEGEGEKVPNKKGVKVILHYEIFHLNGAVFSTSKNYLQKNYLQEKNFTRKKNNFFLFTIGENEVIGGFESSIKTMKKGEICDVEANFQFCFGVLGAPPLVPPPSSSSSSSSNTLKFRIEILNFLDNFSLEETNEIKDQIKKALKEKEEGNKLFIGKDYRKATNFYHRSLTILNNIKNLSEEEEEEIAQVKIPIYLNLAASYLKLNEFSKALSFCHHVLSLDRNNVKGLFRMGEAYLSLNEIDAAKENLLKAYNLNKNDANIKKLLRTTIDLEKKQLEKQKQLFGSFFSSE